MLDQQVGEPPAKLEEVYFSLRARLLMRLQRYEEAAELLDAFSEDHPLNAYLRYNLAISWINGKHPGLGQEWLWQLANVPPGDAQVNAIKEKAMLALAIYMLRSDQEDRALACCRRSPGRSVCGYFLLLYARALLIENQPRKALPVLQQLDKKSIQRLPVQEAQLAIPYLYEQMGDQRSARQAFETALDRFAGLQQYLLEVEADIASGEWFTAMVGEPRWSTAMDPVPPFLPRRVESFPTFMNGSPPPNFNAAGIIPRVVAAEEPADSMAGEAAGLRDIDGCPSAQAGRNPACGPGVIGRFVTAGFPGPHDPFAAPLR